MILIYVNALGVFRNRNYRQLGSQSGGYDWRGRLPDKRSAAVSRSDQNSLRALLVTEIKKKGVKKPKKDKGKSLF